MPRIKDDDQDRVKLSVNFGEAADFLKVNDQESIEISDLSTCRVGWYVLSFILNDNIDQVEEKI